jgi:hypothetical protein
MDFTIKKYQKFLDELIKSGYSFQTIYDFVTNPLEKVVVLRHDVDKMPLVSLKFALLQSKMGICGSYYFRIVPESFDKEIIKTIYALGHEIGYHYETLDTSNGDIHDAYNEFCRNLDLFRKIVPVQTICMHGSPTSRFDNRAIWDHYSYMLLGITAEPYFDIDFDKVFYLTDTGRRFDGERVSIRDKPRQNIVTQWPSYHSMFNILNAIRENSFPKVVMMTLHPQRWTDNWFYWTKEYYLQNLKNVVKKRIVKKQESLDNIKLNNESKEI